MRVKFIEGLYVITMKDYATFEKELAFYFKLTPQFDDFLPEHSNISKIAL